MAFGKVEPGTPKYFALCGLGGIFSCGLTHTAVTPIDLLKCNAQNNKQLFSKGVFGNAGILMKHRGVTGLFRGWAPTFVGYSFQGLGKFGLYEVFKHKLTAALGEERVHNSAILAPLVHMIFFFRIKI
jgi:solute carrier family 25 (mitochondrial phosphate transporter), member 3